MPRHRVQVSAYSRTRKTPSSWPSVFFNTLLVWWLQSSDAIRNRMHPSWIAPLTGHSSLELLAVTIATPRRSASPRRRLRPLGSYQTLEPPH